MLSIQYTVMKKMVNNESRTFNKLSENKIIHKSGTSWLIWTEDISNILCWSGRHASTNLSHVYCTMS